MLAKTAVAGFLLLSSATALAEGHAIGLKAGALGLGIEYTRSFSDRMALRAGVNGSKLGFDAEESGIDYEFDFVWDSISVAFDFHPLTTALRVTGGVLFNDNRLEASSRPSGSVTIGSDTYTSAEVGTLMGRMGFDGTALFAGVGWDWSKRKRVGMSLDVGILDQGAPSVSLRGNGTLLGDPMFQADIAAEEAELSSSLDDFDLMPYLTLGVVVRF
jgi:hypothetical protein